MITSLIPMLQPVLSKVVNKVLPNADKGSKEIIEQEILGQLIKHQPEIDKAATSIMQTEAASSNWLAASWRPLTMIVFVGLITARWFGWTAPNLSEAEYIKLWSIVEFGMGGYMVGRSAEKIIPKLMEGLKK